MAAFIYYHFREGPVDIRILRYLVSISPDFESWGSHWIARSFGAILWGNLVLEKRGGLYYLKKEWVEWARDLFRRKGLD